VRWALPLALSVSVLTAGSAGVASTAPRTLAVTHAPIAAFAQDGSRLAWFSWTHGRTCNGGVFVRNASGGAITRLPAARPVPLTCRWDIERFPVRLALSGTRALWQLMAAGNITEQYLFTARLATPRERQVTVVYHDTDGPGDWLTAFAGDLPSAAYAVVRTSYVDEEGRELAIGGGVRRLAGVPLDVPAAELAVAGTRALTARATATERARPVAGPTALVEAWNLRTGARFGSFRSPGTVRSLALAYPYAVALADMGSTRVLVRANLADGAQRFTPVGRNATQLTASGTTAVYRIAREIHAVDLLDGATRLLARASATPVGLSIEGNRVAWGENVGGRGRIRALTLTQR
jgi:hypothetical protein